MTPSPSADAAASPARRVVLVDLAPAEFRFLSELVQRPGISVRLLVLPPEGTAGAEVVSDVALTRDLGDLARYEFDLALVGASCARRAQIERILLARGTPVQLLEAFLASEIVSDRIDAMQRIQGTARTDTQLMRLRDAGFDLRALRSEPPAPPAPRSAGSDAPPARTESQILRMGEAGFEPPPARTDSQILRTREGGADPPPAHTESQSMRLRDLAPEPPPARTESQIIRMREPGDPPLARTESQVLRLRPPGADVSPPFVRDSAEATRPLAEPPRMPSPPEAGVLPADALAEGLDDEPLGEMPLPGHPAALERALARWVLMFGATSAELHGGDADYIEWVCRSGDEDPLLKCIIALALEHDSPQVISLLDGYQRGRLYAAWPFRAGFRRGILAAGGLDPRHGRVQWERVVRGLVTAWEGHDRERAGPSFPMVPGAQAGWLSAASFRHRLSLAVERNRRDGLRFEAHRIVLSGPMECVEALSRALPRKLRDTDCVCRPAPRSLLLLVAGPAEAVAHVRHRISSVWQESWQAHVGDGAPQSLSVERVELVKPGDAGGFMATATAWLSGG